MSESWLASGWCRKEFQLAHRLNKHLFGALIEDIPIARLPAEMTGTWQLVPLVSGRDHIMRTVVLPTTHQEVHVTFSQEGLTRLKLGLQRAGVDAILLAARWRSEASLSAAAAVIISLAAAHCALHFYDPPRFRRLQPYW